MLIEEKQKFEKWYNRARFKKTPQREHYCRLSFLVACNIKNKEIEKLKEKISALNEDLYYARNVELKRR